MPARDLKGAVRRIGKKLFQFVGALREANTISDEDHSVLDISVLPRLQEVVSRRQGEGIARVRGCRIG